MSDIQIPDRWVLIRVVGPRVPECFKLLTGMHAPADPRNGEWTFTTAVVSAAGEAGNVLASTASASFRLTPSTDCYAFTVKTAEIFVKMHRIAENNGMTFHVVDQNEVMSTLARYWDGNPATALPQQLSGN